MGFLAPMMAVGAVAAVAVAYYAGFNAGGAEHEAAANRAAIAARDQTIEQQREDIDLSESLRTEGNERLQQNEQTAAERVAALRQEHAAAEARQRAEMERWKDQALQTPECPQPPPGGEQCAWDCRLPPFPDSS